MDFATNLKFMNDFQRMTTPGTGSVVRFSKEEMLFEQQKIADEMKKSERTGTSYLAQTSQDALS